MTALKLWNASVGAFLILFFCLPSKASTSCDTALNSGSGEGLMNVCISNAGNLVGFQSPSGFEHIRIGTIGEGYIVCHGSMVSPTVDGFDAGFDARGWGAPMVIQPNGQNTLPLTILRNTSNGNFQLKQVFTRNTSEREVTVTMTLTNISKSTLFFPSLQRYVDFDIDNTSADDIFFADENTVFAEQANTVSPVKDGSGHAMSITALPFGSGTLVEKASLWFAASGTHTSCGGTGQVTPTAGQSGAAGAGNYVDRIRFDFFSLNPGSSTSPVKLIYRRQ
jgi:hypothetical protein